MKYRFESVHVNEGRLTLQGFLIGNHPESTGSYEVYDANHEPKDFLLEKIVRNDVGARFFGKVDENQYGFSISFAYKEKDVDTLVFTIENQEIKVRIHDAYLKRVNAWNDFKNNAGVQNFVYKIRHIGQGKITYPKWYEKHKPTKNELQQQRQMVWKEDSPKFSIVIPLYKTPVKFLKELLKTIEAQTYQKFEVCFADGSPSDELQKIIAQEKDERLRYVHLEENGGISTNTNAAMKMATGDFIVLCDHDDLLCENALYEFAKRIVENPNCDCIYSDEDKIDNQGNLFQPHFKPDYNVDLLANNNYICHIFAVRTSFVHQYGMLDSKYDGAQDHDFILRMCEQARDVEHVAKVLYHWRSHAASTASNADAKLYAFKAGEKAVQAHYERVWPQYPVDHVETGCSYGIYHTTFKITEEPLISVIIPNKDHIEELKEAVQSLYEINTWKNFEMIIVENNSEREETFAYYQTLEQQHNNIHVVKYDGEFNYSKINNYGVQHAKGEIYFFLNNDTKMIEPSSLQEMYSYIQREDVGIVGCRLLYPDQTIQHAGVIVGIGVADHAFKGQLSDAGQTYFNRAMTVQDYSAVTAAAMMTKKAVFESVGGFEEQLAVAFNDIDYCLKVRKLQKLVVYNPYACFYHYESKSRGQDHNEEKRARYMQELSVFNTKWSSFLKEGDPYYNCNLTLEQTDFSLKQ